MEAWSYLQLTVCTRRKRKRKRNRVTLLSAIQHDVNLLMKTAAAQPFGGCRQPY
jgi:hypothetical protein